jgi:hypothetical protein
MCRDFLFLVFITYPLFFCLLLNTSTTNVVLVPTAKPTAKPTTSPTTSECLDTPNWVDKDGDGCDWYEENDYPGCPSYGNTGGNMGIANENCCHCVN